MQDDTKEGAIDLQATVVFDEARIFLNLFMKKLTLERVVPIVSASVSCDILGLNDVRLVLLSITCKQQKSPGQAFLQSN